MKADMLNLNGEKSTKIDLPEQFNEPYNPDLIKRAVLAIQSITKKVYGTFPRAGKRASAKLSKRRRSYRGSYGFGISRVPRKILSRRGRRFFWVGAFAPGTVGGRKAHPPKSSKNLILKINKKERKKAIRSALSASINKEFIKEDYSYLKEYPLILDSKIENVKKQKEALAILKSLGLDKELEKSKKKKIRAGKGKLRGRKYRKRAGLLIVVSKDCSLIKAVRNIPGIETKIVNNLNAAVLSRGTKPGRLTIYSQDSIKKIAKENMFMN